MEGGQLVTIAAWSPQDRWAERSDPERYVGMVTAMLCKYLPSWLALYYPQLVTALGSFMLRVLSSRRQLSTALCWVFLAAAKSSQYLCVLSAAHFVSSKELKTVHNNRWQLSAAGDSSKQLVTALSSWWQLSAVGDIYQQLKTALSSWWQPSAADESSQQLVTAFSGL